MSRWLKLRRVIPILLIFAFVLTGCSLTGQEANPLNPKGSVGQEQLWLIQLSLIIMIAVLIVVFVLFFYALIRFRKRKGQNDIPKQVEGNHVLEVVWTVIPLILIIVLAVPSVYYTVKFAKDYSAHKDAVQVKVTAHQYWWEFEYKDYGVITAQELYIPVDKIVNAELVSADVAHSFWIPGLAGKQDTIPGVTNNLYFDAEETGVYRGKCAELCGASHALMDFRVVAVTQDEFDAWIESMQQPTVAAEGTEAGQEVFKNKCMSCHATDSTQFGVYPNLSNFGDRELVAGYRPNTEEWLEKWITEPQEVKPGTLMPAVDLTEEEVDELVKYLHSLKK